MKRHRFFILLPVFLFFITSCGGADEDDFNTSAGLNSATVSETPVTTTQNTTTDTTTITTTTVTAPFDTTATAKEQETLTPEQLLKNMTLHEKVGQLIFIQPEDLTSGNTIVTAFSDEMMKMLKKYPVGGMVLFGENIKTPLQTQKLIQDMQNASEIQLFMCIDEEGGRVTRIANNPNFNAIAFPSMQEIGETENPKEAYNVGFTIGAYLKKYGFHVDFAPVADVNTNPDNIVIGDRAFGSDPLMVGKMVVEVIKGLRDAEIVSCAKHFPGHGDTFGDTHDGYVKIDKSWDELKKAELIPFQDAINASVDMVMISHVSTPNITGNQLPASLSYELIQNKLRREMGFQGIIITDALKMGAIANEYSSKQSAVLALSAGVDILLMPKDYVSAYEGILEAIKNGKLTEERIDQSVLKILKLKEKYGLLN